MTYVPRDEAFLESRLLQAISDRSADVIFAKDRHGRIRFANPATLALIGKSASEVMGKTDLEFLDDEEAARQVMENDRRIMDSGVPTEIEERVPWPDGTVRRWLSRKVPYRDAAGRVVGLLGISRDVTEAKLAEERLQASETRYRALFENMVEGFALGEAIVDDGGRPMDFRFLEVNAAFEQQSGLTQAILGRPVREVLPNLEQHWVERYCGVALTGKPIRFVDYNKDTNRHYDVFCYSPSSGHFAILFRDVTDEQRTRDERERLYREAEEANRLKDDFLATLSHELRTPLTAILGWARLLEQGGVSEPMVRQAHATIARNAEAQRQLLTDVLDVSRMISGKMRLEVKELDAMEVVSLAAASIQPAVDAKDLQLEIVSDASSACLIADPDRLQQIVWNLLSNAVKFTPPGGRIRVSMSRRRDALDIAVSDTGVGISPAFVPKLFTRFAQADSSAARRYGGLGLGLSIVRHLAELHGGRVFAQSAGEGQGSTFTVTLPARAVSRRLEPETGAHAPRPGGGVDLSPLRGLPVLVVDDMEDARGMIAAVLHGAGVGVTLAAGAEEALRQVTAVRPRVVLADIGMPRIDGYEFVRRLRALPADLGGHTPVLALTAFGGQSDRARALAAGFDDHLAKPVFPDELLAAVVSACVRGHSCPGCSSSLRRQGVG